MPSRPRRGRPAKYVKSPNGKPVVGLSVDKNGYYYTFWRGEGLKKRPHFGPSWDYEGALNRYRSWLSRRNNKTFNLSIKETYGSEISGISETVQRKLYTKKQADLLNKLAREAGENEKDYPIGENPEWETVFDVDLDEATIWERFRSLLVADIHTVREKTGLHVIVNDPPPQTKKTSISVMFDFYLENVMPCDAEARGCRNAWKYFGNIIGRKFVNDIVEADIVGYRKELLRLLRGKEESADWVKRKIERPKTILRCNRDLNIEAKAEAKRVLELCSILKAPDTEEKEPKAITRKDFHLFLEATKDVKHKIYLLLMFNCGYYSADICDLTKKNIMVKEGHTYLIMKRDKTKKRFKRVNALLPETKTLLDEYISQSSNLSDSAILFRNSKGKPETEKSIEGWFYRLRNKNDKQLENKKTSIRWLRKACASNLHLKVKNDLIKLTLGQKIAGGGETYKYIEINPEPTLEVVEVLHKAFFE